MTKDERFRKVNEGEIKVSDLGYNELIEFERWCKANIDKKPTPPQIENQPVESQPKPQPRPQPKVNKVDFPSDVLENTFFGDYERAYEGRNETCQKSMLNLKHTLYTIEINRHSRAFAWHFVCFCVCNRIHWGSPVCETLVVSHWK